MNYVVRPKANLPKAPAWTVNRPTQIAAKPKKLNIVTRRYEISWRDGNGLTESKPIVAPALPVFERAFNSFVQGTLIQTKDGYTAIEDLQPGDLVATADNGLQPLNWIGSMMVFPQSQELGLPSCSLYRVTDESYGRDSQAPDLMLGPGARILPGVLATNSASALREPEELVDGQSVICINPVAQLRVFHLALPSHSLLRANGVLAESYHPGLAPGRELTPELFTHFLALFPHLRNLDGFGPLRHKRHE